MTTRPRFVLFVFLLSVILARASSAQTQAAQPAQPGAATTPPIRVNESVVVTATGKAEAITQVGASITVISHDEIEQRHALSMIDLLRTVPGIAAAASGGVGTVTSVWTRGGESSYNKVLVDGVTLNEPGGTFNFGNLSPENIDHIEVLRGAHSALFGSDAMASVIQIFTIRPSGSTPQLNVTLDGGNYSTMHVAANVGAVRGPLEYSLSGSRLSTDNREPNNANKTTTFSGMLAARPHTGGTVKFIGRTEFGKTGTPGATVFGRPDLDAFYKHHDGDFLAGWNQALGSKVLQNASYAFTKTSYRSTNLVADAPYTPTYGTLKAPFQFSDFTSDTGTKVARHHLDYRADATLAPNQTLTFAFAYDGEGAELTDYVTKAAPQKPTRKNTGTTIQYETLAGPVSLVGGIRFEHNGSFGNYVAPRVAVSWLAPSKSDSGTTTRIKASAGLGIKEPTFRQSYSTSIYDLGNPDLKPERSRGFDAGVEQRFAQGRLRTEITYFFNHFDDLIGTGPSDPVTFGSSYVNIGNTRAQGVEFSADAIASGGLTVHGSYVFLDGEVIDSNNSFSVIYAPGMQLVRRPRHSASLQGLYSHDRVSVTLGLLFVGKRVDSDFKSLADATHPNGLLSNDSYTTINAGFDVRVARRTSGFINFENLADSDYMDPLGYRGLGRTVRLGIRTRF